MGLSDEFSDNELGKARLRWITQLTKQLNGIEAMSWNGDRVELRPYYKVHPTAWTLEPHTIIGNEHGASMTKYPLEEAQRELFTRLKSERMSYRDVIKALVDSGKQEKSSQIVIRLMEAGLLSAFDKDGKRVQVQDRLRFDGVGEEYEV
jgi:hypothetical protein